jgi:transposase
MSSEKTSLKIVQMQKRATEKALTETGGNRTRAAEILGVSVRTVRNWIRRYELGLKFPYQRGRQK